jgi:hypothetical protein
MSDELIKRLRKYHEVMAPIPNMPSLATEAADLIELQAARIAALEAKVASGGDRDAWQPIETAPQTGRTLLLGYPNALGKWRTVRGQWMSQAYIDEYWEDPDDTEPGWFETPEEAEDPPNCWAITPTHWMPLPAPPAALQHPAKEPTNG